MVEALVFRAVPIYQAQIGINDTPITRALEDGQFKLAQQLILENTDRSYLDEGPFVKIPLALVLSGDPEFRKHPRHLGLAKLLVERGANPNLRIPTSELQRASPSPMEYLINLLSSTRDLVLQESIFSSVDHHASLQATEEEDEDITNPLRTIGLNGEEKLSAEELRDQLLTLLDVYLVNGGDPNVTTSISNSTLYHIVLSDYDPDIEVALKLCEAGGNLNIPNGHGTTPLMDLISYADGDAALDILRTIWDKNPDISSLETQNYANETALWRAMLAGSPQLAVDLLHRGADPGHRAKVYVARWHRLPSLEHVDRLYGVEASSNGVSALYAPLLQQSSPYKYHTAVCTYSRLESVERPSAFDVSLMNKVMACAVYPVVDNTYTSELFTPQVVLELEKLMFSETKFEAHEIVPKGMMMQDIGALLFGHLKAGLQQLCVRQIMQHVFFQKPASNAFELLKELKGAEDETETESRNTVKKPAIETVENWDDEPPETTPGDACPDSESSSEYVGLEESQSSRKNSRADSNIIIDHWYLIHKLCPSVIRKLVVSVLCLPSILVPRFEIEAARLQLSASMYTYEHVGNMVDWEGMSYEGSTDPFLDDLVDDDGVIDFEEGIDDDDDDYDDDDSDYRFFVRHCAYSGGADTSFTFPSSSSSEDDILFPVQDEAPVVERSSDMSESQNDAQNETFPSVYTGTDMASLEASEAKNVHENETPASDNCSSEEHVPSGVCRDEYQKLTSDFCSTSSSDVTSSSTVNSEEADSR